MHRFRNAFSTGAAGARNTAGTMSRSSSTTTTTATTASSSASMTAPTAGAVSAIVCGGGEYMIPSSATPIGRAMTSKLGASATATRAPRSQEFHTAASLRSSPNESNTTTTHSDPSWQHPYPKEEHKEQQQPEPPEPILLLEGDRLCVSSNGISRTFYELVVPDANNKNDSDGECHIPPIAIEEVYNLKTAGKQFILRKEDPLHHGCIDNNDSNNHVYDHPRDHDHKAVLGPQLLLLDVQEIRRGIDAGCGTGSTTWEASIAMSLYFSAHPEQLRGHVIELGSGVGLGGILMNIGPRFHRRYDNGVRDPHAPPSHSHPHHPHHPHAIDSMTLTDVNDDVLRQCRQNVQRVFGIIPKDPCINVSKLDWYDEHQPQQYHTVIACDCAYRMEDVQPLARTLRRLLLKEEDGGDDSNNTIHLFGPYNRAAFQELIRYMIDEMGMKVVIEVIEMNRFRLKPEERQAYDTRDPFPWQRGWNFRSRQDDRRRGRGANRNRPSGEERESEYTSKYESKFLHVTCRHKERRDYENEETKDSDPSEID